MNLVTGNSVYITLIKARFVLKKINKEKEVGNKFHTRSTKEILIQKYFLEKAALKFRNLNIRVAKLKNF